MNDFIRLPNPNPKDGKMDLAGILGFALLTIVTIAVAKRVPFVKTLI